MLAQACLSVGRKIKKAHRARQTPHGKQTVRQLMGHGAATNSIEVESPKDFDRVARKWNVDYAFYKTGPDKYLLFFKSGQADAITACFSEYSRRVMKRKELQDAIHEMLTTEGPFLLEACVIEEGNVLPMTPPGSSVNQMLLEC